jgi:hypothetical protein
MSTIDETDPNTQTIASAWASSPLGDPVSGPTELWETDGPTEAVAPPDDQPPVAKRAILSAALASGVIGGAALGVMLFDYTDSAQPTVVVPRSESRLPGPPPALPTETRLAPSSNPVVPQPRTAPAPTVAVAPSGPASPDVGKPPVGAEGDTTVVVDIPIPDFPPLPEKPDQQDPEPPKPEDPDPEPPKPEPPVLDDQIFKMPDLPPVPPEPEPDPHPPKFMPDLPLAPVPNPDPVIKLPLVPSPKLNPQPEPPSLPNFLPQAGLGS